MNSKNPSDVRFSFSGFSQRAGNTGDHVDGWGIAFFEGQGGSDGDDPAEQDKGLRLFVDHQNAIDSPVAQMIRDYPIKSRQVISHIRKATVGRVALQNCHPFVRELWGRYWVFAHNGDLKNYAPRLHASFRPVGGTDSELAFCWLMQEISKSHANVPSIPELTLTLKELCPQIAKHGTFNFLLSNGEALWAHATTKLYALERRYPFQQVTLSDEDMSINLADEFAVNDSVSIVATEPLTKDEDWSAFAPGELRVFHQGAPFLS